MSRRPLIWLLLAGPLIACTGLVDPGADLGQGTPEKGPGPGRGDSQGDGTGPGSDRTPDRGAAAPNTCTSESPGLPTLRRLTSEELGRSLKVLLGRDIAVGWPADEVVAGYPSAQGNQVLETHARALYGSLLPELRKLVESGLAGLSDGCTAADTKCATSLAQGFASRAWRRTLSQDERTSLVAFYEQVKAGLGDKEATANLLLTILSSPHFLYRSEVGVAEGATGLRRLTSREVGTALSYFFWGQPPDAMLLARMDADGLQTADQIRAEIGRLSSGPTHAAWMGRFFQQWTHVQGLDEKDHALDRYPDATKAYKKEAEEALVRQFVGLLGKPGATYEELVSGRSFVAGPLTAKAYQAGAKLTGFQPIEAEPGRRGVFMSVGFLTQYSKPDGPNAIERAKFFLDQVVCRELPGIPADALQREFTPDPMKSPRQNFENLTKDAACSACHSMMNPIGFAFDKFGADGQILRQIEGFPVDTRGTVKGTVDVDGELTGPEDFILRVAKSREARGCYLRQWFRFANGRQENAKVDGCTLQRLLDTMGKEGDALTTFARHYFTSRNFLYRQAQVTP